MTRVRPCYNTVTSKPSKFHLARFRPIHIFDTHYTQCHRCTHILTYTLSVSLSCWILRSISRRQNYVNSIYFLFELRCSSSSSCTLALFFVLNPPSFLCHAHFSSPNKEKGGLLLIFGECNSVSLSFLCPFFAFLFFYYFCYTITTITSVYTTSRADHLLLRAGTRVHTLHRRPTAAMLEGRRALSLILLLFSCVRLRILSLSVVVSITALTPSPALRLIRFRVSSPI